MSEGPDKDCEWASAVVRQSTISLGRAKAYNDVLQVIRPPERLHLGKANGPTGIGVERILDLL
jgi:hypothetical protein